jgi:cytoskeletal protein CcmA (bactofilin family)
VWNKRTDESVRGQVEEPAPRESAAPPPRENAAPPPRNSGGVIGSTMRIKGDIYAQEELYIDGDIEGSLSLQHALTVGPQGKVRANIKARELTILGKVQGNVEVSGKLAIRGQGSLVGDVRTAGISIDDGAYFKGGIDIVRTEPARNGKPQGAAEPAPPAVRANTAV